MTLSTSSDPEESMGGVVYYKTQLSSDYLASLVLDPDYSTWYYFFLILFFLLQFYMSAFEFFNSSR